MKNQIQKRCQRCLNIEFSEIKKCSKCSSESFESIFDGFEEINPKLSFKGEKSLVKINWENKFVPDWFLRLKEKIV